MEIDPPNSGVYQTNQTSNMSIENGDVLMNEAEQNEQYKGFGVVLNQFNLPPNLLNYLPPLSLPGPIVQQQANTSMPRYPTELNDSFYVPTPSLAPGLNTKLHRRQRSLHVLLNHALTNDHGTKKLFDQRQQRVKSENHMNTSTPNMHSPNPTSTRRSQRKTPRRTQRKTKRERESDREIMNEIAAFLEATISNTGWGEGKSDVVGEERRKSEDEMDFSPNINAQPSIPTAGGYRVQKKKNREHPRKNPRKSKSVRDAQKRVMNDLADSMETTSLGNGYVEGEGKSGGSRERQFHSNYNATGKLFG